MTRDVRPFIGQACLKGTESLASPPVPDMATTGMLRRDRGDI